MAARRNDQSGLAIEFETATCPVVVQLDDGRFARTGYADNSRATAIRTVATINAQRSRWLST